MTRIDHFGNPSAPQANSLVPAASAIVPDLSGRILLHQRSDNGLWSIPGGKMEIGETIGQAIVREVEEETGLRVEPERVIGIYSDPRQIVEYADGEIRQQFSVCFACRLIGGHFRPNSESTAIGFFSVQEIETMSLHNSIRQRIHDYCRGDQQPVFS